MVSEKIIPLDAIRLLIVDDHQMVRDGIKVMLNSLKKQFQFIIDEAESGEEAIRKIIYKDFDIVIIDYKLPGVNGAQAVQDILLYKPKTKVLALSNYDELPYVEKMIASGAKGYVLKNIEPSQLMNAIRSLLSDNFYYSNEVALKLIEDAKKETIKHVRQKHELTKREIEVLKMIAMEMTNEEIADKLFVGKRTIDTHRQNLLNKLHARNTVGLVKAAYKLGLVD